MTTLRHPQRALEKSRRRRPTAAPEQSRPGGAEVCFGILMAQVD